MSLRREFGQTDRATRLLQAYHDGELGNRAKRRFERALSRDSSLERECALLHEMGELARELDAEAETPDLWDQIALRLPAQEALREAERSGVRADPDWDAPTPRWRRGWGKPRTPWALLPPISAIVAAAVVALVMVRFSAAPETGIAEGGVVRWIDSGKRSVMLLEDDGKTGATLIWLLDDAVEGASRGGSHAMA